ncbi:hypothetical protein FRC07_005976 [Ceratobasidium sp. 392]|nr:hypothetical protein FRC07_005976 [Ceratobasidium sp. 392]
MLHEHGCTLATKEWAKNHWGQIVWKLAGMASTGAEGVKGKWSWEEVSRQMLYRYEREINRAERPAVRLIQEHDASPAQAMVLCVSDIQLHDNDEAEIELTDGWYRIRTVSDKTLARAAKKGKLAVGRKIALEGGTEGKEVLKAYQSSALKIGGNSTSLAPWDARLGFQPCPYIASLRSLTADGGPVALLDVQVLKLFPVGFVETDQTGQSSKPRDQSGEDEAQRAWEERRINEASKWRIQFEKQIERMKAAVGKLEYTARGVNANPEASPPSEAENFLEEFEDNGFDPEYLKSHRPSPAGSAWLASVIQTKCDDLYERREEEMERELAHTCSPRKVRNFRVAVIKDAQTLRRPTERQAQLTVWDVLSFGSDTLRVGQRYLAWNHCKSYSELSYPITGHMFLEIIKADWDVDGIQSQNKAPVKCNSRNISGCSPKAEDIVRSLAEVAPGESELSPKILAAFDLLTSADECEGQQAISVIGPFDNKNAWELAYTVNTLEEALTLPEDSVRVIHGGSMDGFFDYGYCQYPEDEISVYVAHGCRLYVLTAMLSILDAATNGRVSPRRFWNFALSRGHFEKHNYRVLPGVKYGPIENYWDERPWLFGDLSYTDVAALEMKETAEDIVEVLRTRGYWMWMRPDRFPVEPSYSSQPTTLNDLVPPSELASPASIFKLPPELLYSLSLHSSISDMVSLAISNKVFYFRLLGTCSARNTLAKNWSGGTKGTEMM